MSQDGDGKKKSTINFDILLEELSWSRRRIRDLERRLSAQNPEKLPVDQLNILSETAIGLVDLKSDDDVFEFVGQKLHALLPGAVVIISEYLPEEDAFVCRSAFGFGSSVNKVFELLGGSPIGQLYPVQDEFARHELMSGTLVKIAGGVHELTFGKIPRPVASMVEKILNIGDIHAMAFVRNGVMVGDAVIVCRKGQEIEKRIVEAIAAQAAVTIQRQRAEHEREKLEEQLQKAQRLEAIGKLAGGISHDFNNILTGINGNVELARMDLDESDPMNEVLGEIGNAAARASVLTRQLLAFCRSQIFDVKSVELNGFIREHEDMLTRLMGGKIRVELKLADQNLRVSVDLKQFEHVLVSLAQNARDAMPAGGVLTVTTGPLHLNTSTPFSSRSLEPGNYIEISIQDSGQGIPLEIIEKVFDPFFTTKPFGKGTGLGLATAYGIVHQHGGAIDLISQPGNGLRVRVILPKTMLGEEAPRLQIRSHTTISDFQEGTIMVVEDEPIVRNIASKVLKRLGYKVIEAASGEEALATLRFFTSRIDMLITDVAMPGMNGRELADLFVQAVPNIRILFTSGYTNDHLASEGVHCREVQFLAKPYSPQTLMQLVQKMMKD
jgi:signal transduction histidine kinase/ActR/RegA family two-component response regulator